MAEHRNQHVPPVPSGSTLKEALSRWGDPESAQEMLCLVRQGCDAPMILSTSGPLSPAEERGLRYLSLREKLESEILERLRQGQLVATGYDSRAALDAPPITIPADRWRVLTPDFNKSSATAVGFTVVGILVFEGETQKKPKPNRSAGRLAPARLREWYRSWIDQNTCMGTIPSRDEDWAAAKQALGESVPRDAVRTLREELAPAHWRKKGRRKSATQSGD